MANLNFDATSVDPAVGQPDPVPNGYYDVQIDESDVKPTTAGDGSYAEFRLNILSGQYANRKIFARLNIVNPNPIAQEIGIKQLSALGYAVNVLQIADTQQLHGIPFQVKVKIRPAKGDYDASNEIVGFYAANTHPTGGQGQAQGSPFGNTAKPQQTNNPWANQPQSQPQQQANTGWQGQGNQNQAQPQGQGWGQPQQSQPQQQNQAWGQQQQAQPQQTQQQYAPQNTQQQQTQQAEPQQQQQQSQPWAQGNAQSQPWTQGQPQQQQQATQQAQQQVTQQQNQAPINQQPANYQIPEGQTAQDQTPPWAQQQ